jgi:hypothetical protein
VGSCTAAWTYIGPKILTPAANSTNNYAEWFLKNTGTNSITLVGDTPTKSGAGVAAVRRLAWTTFPFSLAPGQQIDAGVTYDAASSGTGTVGLTVTTNCATFTAPSHSVTVKVVQVGSRIPMGLFGMTPISSTPFTGGHLTYKVATAINQVLTQLGKASSQSPRWGMWFNILAGNEQAFMNGTAFSMQSWDDSLHAHMGPLQSDSTSTSMPQLQQHIADSTLQGFTLLDDIQNFSPAITAAQLDRMAAHFKRHFPGVLTSVRARATQLEGRLPSGGSYTQLDVAWAQYQNRVGQNTRVYRDAEIASAQRMHLGLVLGVNINDGYGPDKMPVPPDLLLAWADTLLSQSATGFYACGFYMWNDGYPQLRDSTGSYNPIFTTIANKALAHPASACRRH